MKTNVLTFFPFCWVAFSTFADYLCFAKPLRWAELSEDYSFEAYCHDYGKNYTDSIEWKYRKQKFQLELASVLEHNKNPSFTWKRGINHLSDRSKEELRSMNGLSVRSSAEHSSHQQAYETEVLIKRSLIHIPESVDWRQHRPSVITPVKNQGACGSCWTFGVVESVESHWAIKYPGKLFILSEQQVASCPFATNPDNCGGKGGCKGGTMEVGYESIIKAGGLASEWTYPYRSFSGNDYECDSHISSLRKEAKLKGYVKLPENQYQPLLESLIHKGPIAISVDASAWSSYEEGVFDGCNQTHPEIDHAVQLVGYGIDDKLGPYWLIRNSWSPDWGENGYIRIRRTDPAKEKIRCGVDVKPKQGTGCDHSNKTQYVCGTCGILFDTSYPIVE